MDKKSSLPSLDAALENLDPTRRHFLGLMLAGAATLPALTTTALAAQASDKNVKQTIKPSAASDKTANSGAAYKDKPVIRDAAPSDKTAPGYKEKWPSSDATVKDKGGSSASPSDKERSGIGSTQKNSDSSTVKGSESKNAKAPDSTVKSSDSQSKSAPQDKQKPSTSDSHIYMK